ncbi:MULTISPECIES: low temperature requirement protein A [Rhodopseudomonas]|uniref:Membrane protein n=1 Tax=Rhodopseudomonas palustris TaxID=1076 RepID=A0A0D7ESA1_RHOPL|nr:MULTISPECIES: low temperature requirement protein A [Rhodopseudomonas]KIZ43440.1 membrane protein [Rhodopseudomonas palustris]MDF3810194.1 low temperature requirement protein A [Rhodopseudomonas sp. BAL398]WOK20179.1 low temperature requirement protein A [Rhodopseudomonas sp. BAL398]
MTAPPGPSLLRQRKPQQHNRVTYVELFFDLVFVFAITQISHFLLAHFTPLGVLQAAILMLAVWWVWVFTSWITNWLDPERTAVRLMLFALMIAGLLLSTSIPKAFDSRGLAFAGAFAAMQVGRTAFFALAVPRSEPKLKLGFVRILIWLSVSGVFWIAGGLAQSEARLALWLLALLIEYCGPVARFWVPAVGASATTDWSVEGGHMAERCALFIIIALGESVVVTGATFAEIDWTPITLAAFAVALGGAIAMWWIYFHIGVHLGSDKISHSADPGRLARNAYTYLHLPIVAGIVVSAVGDELLLAHPSGHADIKATLSMIGGPLLFLLGMLAFKHSVRARWALSHLAGIVALLALAPLAHWLSPLGLSSLATAILLAVGAWEALSLGAAARAPEL